MTYFLPPARELFGSSLDENLLFWLPAHCHTNRYLCVCVCVLYCRARKQVEYSHSDKDFEDDDGRPNWFTVH